VEIFKQMLECLEQVHLAGYVHRDIKPDNFGVKDGIVKIFDFGVSK